MTTSERVNHLHEAQTYLHEAIELITQALQDTEHERHADAYIIAHLNNWVDAQGYDTGIQQYIEQIMNE
jgi:oligoribonuclease (3'-5' exoribonuclease)